MMKDQINFGGKTRDLVAAYTLLRIVVGVNYFNHGFTQIFNIPGFMDEMVMTMQDSFIRLLPSALCLSSKHRPIYSLSRSLF